MLTTAQTTKTPKFIPSSECRSKITVLLASTTLYNGQAYCGDQLGFMSMANATYAPFEEARGSVYRVEAGADVRDDPEYEPQGRPRETNDHGRVFAGEAECIHTPERVSVMSLLDVLVDILPEVNHPVYRE